MYSVIDNSTGCVCICYLLVSFCCCFKLTREQILIKSMPFMIVKDENIYKLILIPAFLVSKYMVPEQNNTLQQ